MAPHAKVHSNISTISPHYHPTHARIGESARVPDALAQNIMAFLQGSKPRELLTGRCLRKLSRPVADSFASVAALRDPAAESEGSLARPSLAVAGVG